MKKHVRLLVLMAVFLLVSGYLLYQRLYPPFSTARTLDLEGRSSVIPAIYWPARKMTVTLTIASSATPVDVYVQQADDRRDQEIVESDGMKALKTGQPPPRLLGSVQTVQSGRLVFAKPDGVYFHVILVNRGQVATTIRLDLYGR